MALFPDVGPRLNTGSENNILAKMEKFYTESITINQTFWAEAEIDTRFQAGDQTLWGEIYGNIPAARRKMFNFNRIRRVINMISGQQRRNRKSITVIPVENGDAQTADQFTKIIMWACQQENILETISESFQDGIITGMNLLQVWLDYRNDPISGNLKVESCPFNSFLIDPFFRKPDLSDCNGIWKRSYLTKDEAFSLLPDKKEEISEVCGYFGDNDRAKFQYMPEAYNFNLRDLLVYDEFYYKAYRNQKILVDPDNGETIEWKTDDKDKLKEFMRQNPRISVIDQVIPTVRLAIVVQGKVVYDGPNPLGIDRYNFVPVFGYYSPQMLDYSQRVQGVVRGLRDSQFLYNRRKVIELDILEGQINAGWKYKENALVNPKDVFLTGQGKGLALKADAQMTDVEKILPPDIPPSMIQLSELLAREVMEISGVNEELLGSATDEKAGVLSMLRQGAGLTTLQILFDQLDRSQKILGRLMIDIIQSNFSPGKVARILEEQPTDEFYNKAFGRYDAAIEDGLNTTTQRQMQFAQMLQLREAGVPITPEDLIEAATIQNKKQITENMQKQQQQQAQMAQQQAQMEMQMQQAQINLTNKSADAAEGLGMERISRIQENQYQAIENQAEAEKDRDQALLNFVKALKELEDLDITQLEKLIAMHGVVEERENIRQEVVQQQPQDLSSMLGAGQESGTPQQQTTMGVEPQGMPEGMQEGVM